MSNTFLICDADPDLMGSSACSTHANVAVEICNIINQFDKNKCQSMAIYLDDVAALHAINTRKVQHMVDVDLYNYDIWHRYGAKIYKQLSKNYVKDPVVEEAVGMLSTPFSDLRDELVQTWYFQDLETNVYGFLAAEIDYLQHKNMCQFVDQVKDLFNYRKV